MDIASIRGEADTTSRACTRTASAAAPNIHARRRSARRARGCGDRIPEIGSSREVYRDALAIGLEKLEPSHFPPEAFTTLA